jgi:hypothetical protein
MSIQNVLDRFVSSKEPAALVLQGKWGIGKTYFWRKRIIEPYLTKPWRKKYSYISLFGIASLVELKVAIYQATKEFDYDLRHKWWRFLHIRWLWWKAQLWLPTALESAAIPYIRGGLASSYNALSFYFVKDRLICFDDIERRGSGLSLVDFLGLVSQLVEQRNCRVMVILNTDELGKDQATWDEQKEKVFYGEMTYAPSLTQSIELGLEGCESERWYGEAHNCLQLLKVSNIRIVQRTKRFINIAMETAGDRPLRDETVQHIARVITILTFANSGSADGAPSLEFVMQSGPFDLALYSMSDKKGKTDQEQRWMQIVSDYNLFIGADLDKALCRMVVAGYPDPEDLTPALDAFEKDAQRQADKDKWQRAWRLYHDTLAENADELLDALEDAWTRVSKVDHANNLESFARLLRKLGRPEAASRYIQAWADQRKGDRIEELTYDYTSTFGPLKDPELVAAIKTVYDEQRPALPLVEALELMGSNLGVVDEAVSAIAEASPKDIAQVLTDHPGDYLSRSITNTLRLGENPQKPAWASARINMRQACLDIANRSVLSADRMENKFGIKLDQTTTENGTSFTD